jgi:uncharacterized protein (TIGR03437 family)
MQLSKPHLVFVALVVPCLAFADINSSATIPTGSSLNLDTGTVGTSGGDLLFNGSMLVPQGKATALAYPTGGSVFFGTLTQSYIQLSAVGFAATPIPYTSLAVGSVITVQTNGGNYAKLLITVSAPGPAGLLTVQYTSYGAAAAGSTTPPAITMVQNNYSFIVPGLPNYGIAPGSLFIIKGTNLATNVTPVLQSSAPPGLPNSLNGASISVTVNGTTTVPGLYYTSAGQLAAVLPSNTPVGTGTITVTNGTLTSPPAQIVVVQSALGLDVATDANYNFFSTAASASPGQTIILWGSGIGADTANTDKVYPLTQDNLTGIPLQVWIGGLQATILYQGRSQFPGVDQVVVTIPQGISVGCSVSVVAVSGSIVSNSITIPAAQGGGTCTDPASATNPSLLQTLSGKSTISFGILSILQSTEITAATGTVTSNTASAVFDRYPTAAIVTGASNANIPSIGSCVLLTGGTGVTPTGLDAGVISLSGPSVQTTLMALASQPGVSYAMLSSIPSGGGSYTFTGPGGKDVGSFNTTINFPAPLIWTNQASVTTVNRAQGQQVTWSGGAPGTYVSIEGQSTLTSGTSVVSATFDCYAPVSAGQFTVPSWILLALPPNNSGSMSLENSTYPQFFTASGLDYSYGSTGSLIDKAVVYK